MTTKTDRELLELAAKAAGWTGWQSKHGYWNVTSPQGESSTHCHDWPSHSPDTGEKLREPTFADAMSETNWDPLTDDGDALRLAVKCMIDIHFERQSEASPWEAICDWDFSEPFDAPGCDGEATRRAIVRAAAAIGEAMP